MLLADWSLEREVSEFGRTLGEEMLEPTRIYTKDCLRWQTRIWCTPSHVTGGGLASNLARVLPSHLHADIERSSWDVPPVFQVLLDQGVARDDAERTFNMGIGMIAVVADPAPGGGPVGLPWSPSVGVRNRPRTYPEDVSDAPAKGGRGGNGHAARVGRVNRKDDTVAGQ